MSIGRFQAGLAQATQELTMAAANFNFDFTLMKFEAPAEYKSIVREAETGPIHVTARKLGALFEGACPETPNLIKAYGQRASEISKEVSESDPGGSGHFGNWIRSEFGGIDATSIWAAATSSKAALPVHLLACIIARMWTDSEATSLWAEIVIERKKEILSAFEEGAEVPFALASAAQQEITREHLSQWDSSARAWLQTADKSRQRQYKQFLLIIENLSIAVHRNKDVINAWTSALTATEGLISGRPHAVRDGSVLLGISAWHIFPDILVFAGPPTGNIPIAMGDSLVRQGGVLSLGISDPDYREVEGVYWSLSLSHHMHYGEAVKRTRRLDVDGSRLTLDEFFLVCIGSLLRNWSIPTTELLKLLNNHYAPERKKFDCDWWQVIEKSRRAFAVGDKEAKLAVSLGRRRPAFLPAVFSTGRKPLFGLLDISNILFLLADPEGKIKFLRRLATRVPGLNNTNSIILCFDKRPVEGTGVQFSTAFPSMDGDGQPPIRTSRVNQYHRWIQIPDQFRDVYDEAIRKAKDECQIEGDENTDPRRSLHGLVDSIDFPMVDPDEPKQSVELDGSTWGQDFETARDGDQDGLLDARRKFTAMKDEAERKYVEQCADYLTQCERELKAETIEYLGSDQQVDAFEQERYFESHSNEYPAVVPISNDPWSYNSHLDIITSAGQSQDTYEAFFGQNSKREAFQKESLCRHEHAVVYAKHIETSPTEPDITLDDILWCFEYDFIDPTRLNEVLEKEPALGFLQVLAAINEIGRATISCSIVDGVLDPPIFSKGFKDDEWARASLHLSINQASAIALIGYFETGNNFITNMKNVHNIIGLNGGDSIFVRTAILNDPEMTYPEYSFTRILGNIGKSGFSILTSPSNLMVRKLDPAAWRIESSAFDGVPLDQFSNTSLHLSLTDWEVPLVQFQSVGQRNADVNVIEAVISVRDAGKWVADVDICRALVSKQLERQSHSNSGSNGCTHVSQEHSGEGRPLVSERDGELLSIETWDQVLDDTEGPAVVRCYDNHIARLAIISMLCQHSKAAGRPVVICHKTTCWKCHAKRNRQTRDVTYIY
ncbi:hypothetical protein PG997_002263 [Apiospora hydei]|uniref:Uncharacterized protein n=1 Tax=Apiospora hydei TaxID=1337664 RepID=A0ABR1X8X7_9PEZI